MPAAPIIRRGTNADSDEVERLRRLWVAEQNTYGLTIASATDGASLPEGLFLVAESDASLIGFIIAVLHENAVGVVAATRRSTNCMSRRTTAVRAWAARYSTRW